ncbi:hypothetical protein E3Q23_03171 [Wallemia mellicola]|uniref:Ribosome biogenesis protein RLP24 n=1 Tax=Wallemia mellicola TaxID=1708541 RepID=A0A4V4N0M9_9BASI|nr:hypothetical protein E3Q23_03171 [Wallemia mellicola]TIC53473.1 PLP-dependent transferase [Wallemia mellicola]TIC63648.1 PLP-dependent transferase [Wallemia mellicola]
MKVELCSFSGQKIYPSKGRLYVRLDNRVFRFANGKCESLFLQRKNPRKIAWTAFCRKLHKKGVTEEVQKKKGKKSTKNARGIVGLDLEAIQAKRSQKPEVRTAARQEAIKQAKEAKQAKANATKANLPTWKDHTDYEEGAPRVVDAMVTGYPRFFIHRKIQQLSSIIITKFGNSDSESCLLFPINKWAEMCRDFIIPSAKSARLAHLTVCDPSPDPAIPSIEVHAVIFNKDFFSLAKQFWQHTGLGVSSRLAERALDCLEASEKISPTALSKSPSSLSKSPTLTSPPTFLRTGSRNRYNSNKSKFSQTSQPPTPGGSDLVAGKLSNNALKQADEDSNQDIFDKDHAVYVEERYGRNLPLASAPLAKRALKRRIAGVVIDPHVDAAVGPTIESERGAGLTEDDVWLTSTGMAAIWLTHQAAMTWKGAETGKSVCFGFPYTDTLKVLQKWGPGAHFMGRGDDADLEHLEEIASKEQLLAVFCEFPGNPLLKSPDLARLRELADKYGFLIVVDETIGSFMNIDILPLADVVVSSLTKAFSGETNVMGGSIILNPEGSHYEELRDHIVNIYEDSYWFEDAIFMERNSRDFCNRVKKVNENTETLCDWFYNLSELNGSNEGVIKEVFYPKYTTTENYNARKREGGGYGGLFSLTFGSKNNSKERNGDIARIFFDNLDLAAGPSLGCNFTLASCYAILAHYTELDWIEEYGVDRNLIRCSIGLEDVNTLLSAYKFAYEKALEFVRD